MSKPRSHLLDIYSAWLHLATDMKQWKQLRADLVPSLPKNPGALGATNFTVQVLDGGHHVAHFTVFIDVKGHEGSDVALVETCAHEAAHVAGQLFRHLEVKDDSESEPRAYLVGWVTQWLYRWVRAA